MTSQTAQSNCPLRIFIFDSSRLRSHLFFRYMSTHPDLTPIYHPYIPSAMFGPEYLMQYLRHSEERQQELEDLKQVAFGDDTYASSTEDFVRAVADVERSGKIALADEHWHNVFKCDLALDLLRGKTTDLGQNPTCLPDDLFNSITPIILIRHPALSVNSIYRDSLALTKMRHDDEDERLACSNKELRMLFDFFRGRGTQPIVVDGEDILWRTQAMSKALSERLGISDGFMDTWEPTSKDIIDRMNPWVRKLTQNIHASRGIERPAEKPADPSIDKAHQDWIEKYGSDIADVLKAYADENLPHYEYLKQFKA